MGIATITDFKQSVSGKRTFRPSLSTRHANEWPLSEVASDLTIEVGTKSFALHKFPLVSRSGKIRKLLSEAKDSKISRIDLQGTPGGPEALELAAKFCYGVSIDITLSNVAMLRCAAHYLQMTEELSEKNLQLKTEIYLKESVFPNTAASISVLRCCETLLPVSDEINLIGKIVNAIASNVCKEQLTSGLYKLESSTKTTAGVEPLSDDWWGDTLSDLNLDFFQRVISTLRSKGLKQDTSVKILVNYAQNSLQGSFSDAEAQKKQRVVVEAIVSLLPIPSRKSLVPIAFLSGLLKAATSASSSSICKGDLERRMGFQLDQAILEDILIPASWSGNGHQHPIYDSDSVARIFSVFLNFDEDDDERECRGYELGSPRHGTIVKVSKLLDSYLAEVALDSNMMVAKFIALAELLPDHARVVTDGLYRSIDIFLKVHPNIKEGERYRLCKSIDCEKLSQEGCSHAAQNERLPVQMAVQVLYFEQIRLRKAMIGNLDVQRISGSGSGTISPRDNYASVRRENRDLKLEVARMRMRLTDLEKDHVSMKQDLVRVNPANKILTSFANKLNTFFFRIRDVVKPPLMINARAHPRILFQRRRRNSIS